LIIRYAKKVKLKYPKDNCYPWFDKELYKLKHHKEKCYLDFIKDKSSYINQTNFNNAKANYNKLYRQKQIEYFSIKTASDFKESKKFWRFYSRYVKLKSDGKGIENTIALQLNNEISNDKKNVSNAFAGFFGNLKSESILQVNDCKLEIFNHFRANKLGVSGEKFAFSHTYSQEVENLLAGLDINSSPGSINIPVKLLKYCKSQLSLIFTNLFNDCIDNNAIPREWKAATIIPLHKKGDSSDINNFRGISILPTMA
jgi:hypothetical protein